MKHRQALIHRVEQSRRSVGLENKARAGFGAGIVVLHGIFQAANGAHDRNGTIFKAKHLVEAAGLVERRHQEKIRSRLDLVRKGLVEIDARRDLLRIARRRGAKKFLVARRARAEHDELNLALHQRGKNIFNQVESFLRREARNHGQERRIALIGKAERAPELFFARVFQFETVLAIMVR